ncbi:MAG: hypothetical protein IT210_04835 [Armatimonadetes bacterium]|nr:hypothetical protein [Armatimonadota bacterium]
MTHREAALAILNYQPYDRLPVVHFGFWHETLVKWRDEGHLSDEELAAYRGDSSPGEIAIARKLGFDFNWQSMFYPSTGLSPGFESKVVEVHPDGSKSFLNGEGMIILQKEGAGSIPAEIDHLLKDRAAWEELYLPKLRFFEERANREALAALKDDAGRDFPIGLHCGSLYGAIRNWLGVQGSAFLYADDEDLFTEIIDTVGDLCYRCAESALASGAKFDFAHFWEDICFKNGPLISPRVFRQKVGPHYRRITDLVNRAGLNTVSLDCDGNIDALVPIWLENGVNTMFPIEVGTWNASIAPWRERYGKEVRGVGGADKRVFARDFAAVDAEIERLKPLVALGGYIPCPDHRLPPDNEWDNVRYYCDRMREAWG